MPSSNLAVAPAVLHLIWERRPEGRPLQLVDVGPGWGKYGLLVREYVDPSAHLAAVEAWAPYVERHPLRAIYDQVLTVDVLEALNLHARRGDPDTHAAATARSALQLADVVLLADVIEHLPKPQALDLLDLIPGWAVISTPRDYFHNGEGLPPTEDHVSHWTLADFAATGRLDYFDQRLHDELGALVVRLKPKAVPAGG